MAEFKYDEGSVKHLEWQEHIRLRPGMYIGALGDGSAPNDGIYVLLKEVMDNSIDEYMMGFGKKIEVHTSGEQVSIRDYGRGIPLDALKDCVAQMNTGAKYDSEAFVKTVGLNGVGVKAVNALSTLFSVYSVRDGRKKEISFSKGLVTDEKDIENTDEPNGTFVSFIPDNEIFHNFHFRNEYIVNLLKNYSFLNIGLTISLNGEKFQSKNGLKDLLEENMSADPLYPVIHMKGDDIEIAMTHGNQYGEDYYSFVNGQHTTEGGTHQAAFREAVVRTVRDFYKKEFEPSDIRASIIAAISIRVIEPLFESQTKTKLRSNDMGPQGPTVRNFISNFVQKELDNYLHKNQDVAEVLLRRIQESERERKAITGIRKMDKQKSKKSIVNNRKLRDCKIHFNDKAEVRDESSIFITEGDSASGSITTSRDVNTQAVFSLRGKPLNCYGLTKKVVYENEEFNLLQAALNIEESLDDLRYNKVIIATDADDDGMHIRLLLITFFLQFFPELVKKGHLYILQTPLFRVRDKKVTHYCYTDDERQSAIKSLGRNAEITRFKGLGEISPGEFKRFIGPDIRLEPVVMKKHESVSKMLDFYMGKNTPERQDFIIENLYVERDEV
ncbi:MAG: type IIA DNA topoisomerase subunit B [Bacteroidales bacterium]|jgi:topoisomerase-4 subunit B|nr:type IIA DNA topoisomerase subunit B [Bacteroidales bacterium]